MKHTFALLAALLLAPLVVLHAAAAASLLPADWDPALAGDTAMQRLVPITAPQVKGAHQSQMYFRDFDLVTRTFEPRIHRAKLKMAAGVFDMQPCHLYDDAARHGFAKPAKTHERSCTTISPRSRFSVISTNRKRLT